MASFRISRQLKLESRIHFSEQKTLDIDFDREAYFETPLGTTIFIREITCRS